MEELELVYKIRAAIYKQRDNLEKQLDDPNYHLDPEYREHYEWQVSAWYDAADLVEDTIYEWRKEKGLIKTIDFDSIRQE